MAHDRDVGGIRCQEVLEHLSDYVDDDLEPATRARIEAHLRGCDWCEQFGGQYAQTVSELRDLLAAPGSLEGPVTKRLRERLAEALAEGPSADGGTPTTD